MRRTDPRGGDIAGVFAMVLRMWQDIVFSAGSICFIAALVPSLMGNQKPALLTSLLTATILTVFGLTYISLGLYLASITTLITAMLWAILAVQVNNQPTEHDGTTIGGRRPQGLRPDPHSDHEHHRHAGDGRWA